jgi:hypothetical protein
MPNNQSGHVEGKGASIWPSHMTKAHDRRAKDKCQPAQGHMEGAHMTKGPDRGGWVLF